MQIKVEGLSAVKELLAGLPEGADIYWHGVKGFDQVDLREVTELSEYSKKLKLSFQGE